MNVHAPFLLSFFCSLKNLRNTGQPWLVFILSALSFANPALAIDTQGPQLSFQQSGPTDVTVIEQGAERDLGAQESTRYSEFNLLAPIPFPFLGGIIVAKIDLALQSRRYSGENADVLNSSNFDQVNHRDMLGVGGVYLPHAKEGAPKFFVLAARYGKLRDTYNTKPMGEFVIGANMNGNDTPFNIKISPTDEAYISTLVRFRQFPGHQTWYGEIGYEYETADKWHFKLLLPSSIHMGKGQSDRNWYYYFEAAAASRNLVFESSDEFYWSDGFVITTDLGVRKKLSSLFFVSLEVGLQQERQTTFTESGDEVSSTITDFAPWAKLALETWIDTTSK